MRPFEPPIDIDRLTAQREAAEELAKGRYASPWPQWLEDLLRWALEWVSKIMRLLRPGAASSGEGVWAGWLVIGVALLLGLALLVWRFGLPRWNRRVRDAAVETDAAVTAEEYRQTADELAATGDIRAAVRERFRALVRELEVRAVIERRPARTATETARLAGVELPAVADRLDGAAALFNAVMYGDKVPARADYDAMVAADAQVLAAAERGVASLGGGA